ncbi:hypothetical protein M5D96_008904 [Drosophila gunungcola]|uniref:Uncharacterized protein n=1 Tax=Drosophila gunungcola TaxID=103775 RepID=A0A9P9YJM3_9MUSC|nr:hypothetical protein M5D96_008904 [Drosophila gunungcola]
METTTVSKIGQGSPYMWELFYARDRAVTHCGTASRICSVRSRFQSFLYKTDFIFKRHEELRQPCSCYSGGSNKISFNIGIFRYFF